ncbi:LysR family transcriptional regulator [Lysinibacter sp. HNR]|uniref:LysR family transcriptional regulator n=1 Tax=Lysinibacter sp. HNR TaxID=3031408 RepID=UPI002434B667|nr:LysR family transcriptional regulator [Lysinibacter sp. HNR]WGD38645.1 LysR family transcriptional regulator [Lysinibacter sp. HNR]
MQRFSITLTQLTYFVECAKTLNMTEASQVLHVAQSAVSTAISHLETSLGTTLFIRKHARGLVLTPAGESLLRDSHRIFELLNNTIESIRTDQNDIRGSIRIACFSTLAPFLLPRLLGELKQEHPELIIEVIEGDHEDNLTALRSGRAELAVNYNLTNGEGITHEIVGEIRPHIIVHSGHPLAKRKSVTLTDLADDPFVLLDLPDSSEYFLSILRQAGITPKLKYRSSNYETVRTMVATGLGYSILNQKPMIDQTYTGAHTVSIEIKDSVPSLGIAVSALTQLEQSARARVVADTIRGILADSTPRA